MTTADELTGQPLADATAAAEAAGWTVRAHETGAMLTMDFREDRMNLEHEDGVVRRAWVG